MKIANVLISDSWGEVSPEALERGIGGREGAMVYLSREWARLGHEVTCFVNTEESHRFEGKSEAQEWSEKHPGAFGGPYGAEGDMNIPMFADKGFHEYVPLNITKAVLSNFAFDAIVAWECPSVFKEPKILANPALKICEMQVAHFSTGEMQAAEMYCDYVAALSPWAEQFLRHSGLEQVVETVIFPNGVDLSRYPIEEVEAKWTKGGFGDSPKFVYSSSPDRGLLPLLKSWPYILAKWPGASLQVGYGVKKWTEAVKWQHGKAGEMAVEINSLMSQPNILDIGKIGQGELAGLQLESDAWLYPMDPIQATETGCITAVENAAAGNTLIMSNGDCLESEFGDYARIVPLPFNAEGFANTVIDTLEDTDFAISLARKARKFAETRSWKEIAPRWLELFQS